MNEEFTVQCENCGTLYSSLDDVCPYCGEPQPLAYDDEAELPPDYEDEALYLEESEAWDDPDGEFEEEAYLDDEAMDYDPEAYPADEPLLDEDDDIFAIAGETDDELDEAYEDELYEEEYLDEAYEEGYEDDGYEYPQGGYPEDGYPQDGYLDEAYDEVGGYEEELLEEAPPPRRTRRRYLLLGCLGLFVCIGVFLMLGGLATYNGIRENNQETLAEAENQYLQGQDYLANDAVELAIASFERALQLNPNLLPAREALREAQRLAQTLPTPTSETRSAAAAALLETAQVSVDQEDWLAAIETLSQIRDLDPDYEQKTVSDLLYTANYQLGLELITPDRLEEALISFDRALAERPEDSAITLEKTKVTLYLDAKVDKLEGDLGVAIDALDRIYQEDEGYLDVEAQLLELYEAYGDELADEEEWCSAETQYLEALVIDDSRTLQNKADEVGDSCEEAPEVRPTRTPTPRPTQAETTSPDSSGDSETSADAADAVTPEGTDEPTGPPVTTGSIVYSIFNPSESRWEVLSIPATGGSIRTLAVSALMPSVSASGRFLAYRSESVEAEGIHIYDLTTGEDNRITIFRQHVLPQWGGDDGQFVFVAQEPGSDRWRIHQGFTDGLSEAIILREGRTPDLSPNNDLVAYQGVAADGNEPGIYLL
ncbi:MAG: hypothetical protein AAF485_17810, partial [Chloroflexota bacterium]